MANPKTAKQLREVVKVQARDIYNINLSLKEIKSLETAIVNRTSLYLYSFTRTYTFHLVKWGKSLLPVIYDKKRNCLNEIMPALVIEAWLDRSPIKHQHILKQWRKI